MLKVLEIKYERQKPLNPDQFADMLSLIPNDSLCISGVLVAPNSLWIPDGEVVPRTQLKITGKTNKASDLGNGISTYELKYTTMYSEKEFFKDARGDLGDIIMGKLPGAFSLDNAGFGTHEDEIPQLKKLLTTFAKKGYGGYIEISSGTHSVITKRDFGCFKEREIKHGMINSPEIFSMNNAGHFAPATNAILNWLPEIGGHYEWFQELEDGLKRYEFFKTTQ